MSEKTLNLLDLVRYLLSHKKFVFSFSLVVTILAGLGFKHANLEMWHALSTVQISPSFVEEIPYMDRPLPVDFYKSIYAFKVEVNSNAESILKEKLRRLPEVVQLQPDYGFDVIQVSTFHQNKLKAQEHNLKIRDYLISSADTRAENCNEYFAEELQIRKENLSKLKELRALNRKRLEYNSSKSKSKSYLEEFKLALNLNKDELKNRIDAASIRHKAQVGSCNKPRIVTSVAVLPISSSYKIKLIAIFIFSGILSLIFFALRFLMQEL